MNDELLIECVRKYEFLYNLQHPKYMDATRKDIAWKDIGDQMKQPGPACKQKWQSLRDSYRRALKKRTVKTGQTAKKIKKWKYEDEMSFVTPFFAEKKTLDSVDITSDEDNGDHDDHTSETETTIKETASDDVVNHFEGQTAVESSVQNYKPVSQTNESSVQNNKPVKTTRFKNPTPESASASAVLMAQLLDTVAQEEPDELDRFFLNISDTVKKFPKYQQAVVKNKVFSLVSEMELQMYSPATYDHSDYYAPSSVGTSTTAPSARPVPASLHNWNVNQ